MLPTPLPTLTNELVTLRPLVAKDREPLFRVAGDEKLWEQHQCPDRYQRPVFDAMFDDAIACQGAFTVVDRATGRIIGSTRIKAITPTVTEIGWTFLDRQLWGTEYNRSGKLLLIEYLFGRGSDVVFYVNRHNIRSRKAVGKLGALPITDPDDPLFEAKPDALAFRLKRRTRAPAPSTTPAPPR